MQTMTLGDALKRYGDDLLIAGIGAIEKKGNTEEVRVIFDATHGVLLNFVIRVRDHVRCPTCVDIRAVLKEMAREGGTHFGIAYDVAYAH